MATSEDVAPAAAAAIVLLDDVRESITAVEATAVAVCIARSRGATSGPNGKALYDGSFDAAIVDLAMPKEAQEKLAAGVDRTAMMAVRTVAIDDKMLAMLAEGDAKGGTPLRQVVILGAGLDCRAWRLAFPAGTVVYEADSGSVEALKLRSLDRFPRKCTRVFLAADLGLAGDLQAKLAESGHMSSKPTLWLLEGFIGYLTRKQGQAIFRTMAQLSPLGSRVVMTAPPTEQLRKDSLKRDGYKLQHATFEEPHHTLKRLSRQGWSGSIRSSADMSKQYGTPFFSLDQIYAERIAPRGRRGCSVM